MRTIFHKCGREQNSIAAILSSKHCHKQTNKKACPLVNMFPAPFALISLPAHISRHVGDNLWVRGMLFALSYEGLLTHRPKDQNGSSVPPSLKLRNMSSRIQSIKSLISSMSFLILLAVTFITLLMRSSPKRLPTGTNRHAIRAG